MAQRKVYLESKFQQPASAPPVPTPTTTAPKPVPTPATNPNPVAASSAPQMRNVDLPPGYKPSGFVPPPPNGKSVAKPPNGGAVKSFTTSRASPAPFMM